MNYVEDYCGFISLLLFFLDGVNEVPQGPAGGALRCFASKPISGLKKKSIVKSLPCQLNCWETAKILPSAGIALIFPDDFS